MTKDDDMEYQGINIADWNQPIYRVFPLKRIKNILKSGKNGLVWPSEWEDPFENFLLESKVMIQPDEYASLKSIASSWYGQCWTKKSESDAIWRIYSQNKDGVKVKTTIKKLFSTIYEANDKFRQLKYFIGHVEYEDEADIIKFLNNISFTGFAMGGQSNQFAKTLLIKRKEFAHEDEVRILHNDANKKHTGNKVVEFPFDFNNLIEEVVLDPRLKTHEFQSSESELKTLGCAVPISQSSLYKIPKVTIKI